MNELNHIISLVKASSKPVQEVLDNYFRAIEWSLLKDEYARMTKLQKSNLVKKLQGERK